jgi:hypothetical protein
MRKKIIIQQRINQQCRHGSKQCSSMRQQQQQKTQPDKLITIQSDKNVPSLIQSDKIQTITIQSDTLYSLTLYTGRQAIMVLQLLTATAVIQSSKQLK